MNDDWTAPRKSRTEEIREHLARLIAKERSTCREPGCGAPIIWTTTEGRKRMPVDTRVVTMGPRYELRLSSNEVQLIARFRDRDHGVEGHQSHFDTCPVRRARKGLPPIRFADQQPPDPSNEWQRAMAQADMSFHNDLVGVSG